MSTPVPGSAPPATPPRIRFPYGVDGRGRTASSTELAHVRELIEQVLLTAPGERVMRPAFGAALLQRVFEPGGPELLATTQYVVQAALSQELGQRITVDALTVDSLDNQLLVTVTWTMLATGEQRTADLALPGGAA
jgi:phage baseplate assembly protein W